jgi:tetratricopeptide (TPR) repeat protein
MDFHGRTLSPSARPSAGPAGHAKTDADSFLAEQCLRCLSSPEYGSKSSIGRLLRQTIAGPAGRLTVAAQDTDQTAAVRPDDGSASRGGLPYAYAAKYWLYHLTRLSNPSDTLVSLTSQFIRTLPFAYWVEYIVSRSGDLGTYEIWLSETKLWAWWETLADGQRGALGVYRYARTAYLELAEVVRGNGQDNVLPWLALMRLGGLYQDMDRPLEAFETREQVSSGLEALLGRRNPLMLLSLKELGRSHLAMLRFDTALAIFANLAEERETIGPDSRDYWDIQFHLGQTQYLMNDHAAALATLDTVIGRLAALVGVDARPVMIAQLWKETASFRLGDGEKGRKNLQRLAQTSYTIYGADDPTTVRLMTVCGGLHRTAGELDVAMPMLEQTWETWRRACPGSDWPPLTRDIALELIAAKWDAGRLDDVRGLLKHAAQIFWIHQGIYTQQACQVFHLMALFDADDGEIDQSIQTLSWIASDLPRDLYHRSFFWILLDLADLLRTHGHGRHGGEDAAARLFVDILQSTNPTSALAASNDEEGSKMMDSLRRLHLAEKTLRLLRQDKTRDIARLFDVEQVTWVRPADLWFSQRMPSLDTAHLRKTKAIKQASHQH